MGLSYRWVLVFKNHYYYILLTKHFPWHLEYLSFKRTQCRTQGTQGDSLHVSCMVTTLKTYFGFWEIRENWCQMDSTHPTNARSQDNSRFFYELCFSMPCRLWILGRYINCSHISICDPDRWFRPVSEWLSNPYGVLWSKPCFLKAVRRLSLCC